MGAKTSKLGPRQTLDRKNTEFCKSMNKICITLTESAPSKDQNIEEMPIFSADLIQQNVEAPKTVTNLRMPATSSGDLILILNHIFPTLQRLTLTEIRDFPSLAPSLWKFGGGLKFLELWIRLDSPGLIFPGLDAALTGLPKSTVSMMDCLDDPDYDEEVRQIMTENSSSILNLKQLKRFSMIFYKGEWRSFPQGFRLLANSVSGKLVFEEMQSNVRVTARVKVQDRKKQREIEEALEPLVFES